MARVTCTVWVALLVTLGVQAAIPDTSYDILFMMPLCSRSHQYALDPVAEELVRRGHRVTLMSPNKRSTNRAVRDVHLSIVQEVLDKTLNIINYFQGRATDMHFLKNVFNTANAVANATYWEPEVARLLRRSAEEPGFDVMVIDGALNEFVLPLAHHLGLPTVLIAPALKHPYHSWSLDIPHPYAYIPSGAEYIEGPMTFLQRAKNVLMTAGFIVLRNALILKNFEAVVEEFLPGSPPIAQLERQVSFLLSNSHPSVHQSIPSMPYYAEVGCLHCVQGKPLPKELEDFAQSSGADGLIYFSIGSIAKGDNMPQEMRDKVILAFGQLRQKVLWKYESDIEGLPKNIKLVQWAPQQDILAHNKTRLFITHGGGLSIMEAVYHGCPILGFPLSADQWGNVATAVHKGFAESLDWEQFTAEEFLAKIRLMLDDRRYRDQVAELSDLLRDRIEPPVETAAYWIEYVVRHTGAQHLKSGAQNLNFFQYFLLDVIGALIAILVGVIMAVTLALRFLCRTIRRRKSTNEDFDKKRN